MLIKVDDQGVIAIRATTAGTVAPQVVIAIAAAEAARSVAELTAAKITKGLS